MKNNEFQVIISKGMSSIECLRNAKRLLLIQLEHDMKIYNVEKVLGVGDLAEAFPLDLLDIVADLLGVPVDEYEDRGDKETGEYPEDAYCRDWVWMNWSPAHHLKEGDSVDDYVMDYINYLLETPKKGE